MHLRNAALKLDTIGFAASSLSRPFKMISAPFLASDRAIPRPMPDVDPVTTATRPARGANIFCEFEMQLSAGGLGFEDINNRLTQNSKKMLQQEEIFATPDDPAPVGVVAIHGTNLPVSSNINSSDGSVIETDQIDPSDAFQVFAGRAYHSQTVSRGTNKSNKSDPVSRYLKLKVVYNISLYTYSLAKVIRFGLILSRSHMSLPFRF
jgi:hypothetical protein